MISIITTTMNIAMSTKESRMKNARVLFLLSARHARRVVRWTTKRVALDCLGHRTDSVGGEYAGSEESASLGCDSSSVTSV